MVLLIVFVHSLPVLFDFPKRFQLNLHFYLQTIELIRGLQELIEFQDELIAGVPAGALPAYI